MLRSTRCTIIAGALVLLAACDPEIAAPPDLLNDGFSPSASATSAYGLWAAADVGIIRLYWSDIARNDNGFEVHRSTSGAEGAFALLVSVNVSDATTYSDTGVDDNQDYCYKVRYFRKQGNKTQYWDFSNVVCATPLTVPEAPSNLSVIPQDFGEGHLAWQDNSDRENGFRVERATAPEGPWSVIATLPGNSTTYRDGGRPREQLFCYRVIAFNIAGNSEPSNTACTAWLAPPTEPAAAPVNGGRVQITWKDNSAFEDGYEVQRMAQHEPWTAIATVSANTTEYQDGAVVTDTPYWYRIRATRDGGFSASSDAVQGGAPGGPPQAPTNAEAYPVESTVILVTWTSQTFGMDRVERSTDGQLTWVTAATGVRHFYDDHRTAEAEVCYRVTTVNEFGESPPSIPDCTTPPEAPSGVQKQVLEDGTRIMRWTDNSAVEDGFEVWVIDCSGSYGCDWLTHWMPPNSTSRALAPGEAPYGVYALKDGGYSDFAYCCEESAQYGTVRAATTPQNAMRPSHARIRP